MQHTKMMFSENRPRTLFVPGLFGLAAGLQVFSCRCR